MSRDGEKDHAALESSRTPGRDHLLSDGSGTRRRTQPLRGTDRSIVDRFYLAPALFRLGELYEHAGDAKHAAEYHGRFVKLWKNIDSRFQI